MTNVHVQIANKVLEDVKSENYKSLCFNKLTNQERKINLVYLDLLNCCLTDEDYLKLLKS